MLCDIEYALYRLHMVGIQMAYLKYISLHIVLRYFEHSIWIHVWAWIHMAKIIWKQEIFRMNFALKWLVTGYIWLVYNKLTLNIFLYILSYDILTIPYGFHVWAWIHMAKIIWKQAIFHMDYALYKLHMVGIQTAYLKYLSLYIVLRYFDHSIWIHVWAWIHIAKTMQK
jgi:hypothetical protein